MKLGNSVLRRRLAGVLAAIFVLALTCNSSFAQKNKKSKNDSQQQQDDATPVAMPAGSDADQIDQDIGQMLAGFQLGNVDMMHKYYSDSVTFVSGDFAPPIMGWQNYVPLYERQKAGFQSMQLVRRNTIIYPHGDVAWAMYQWEFSALLNGAPYDLRGQTTLVLNKVGGNWLIVHNHTSPISTQTAQAPVQTNAATPPAPAIAKP
jgi:ketosteroid isomerase-like protein